MNVITRRAALGSALAVASLKRAYAQSALRLRTFWWGSKDRAERTNKVNALYGEQTPGTTVAGETLGWSDYWPRLATQAAGRNLPDLIQMDYRYQTEYAGRGALLALDAFMPKTLAIGDFGADSTDCGRVEGKLYGVNLGNNALALCFHEEAFAGAKIPPPNFDTSWAEFEKLCTAATPAFGREGFYATQDCGGSEQTLEYWLRERGRALYTPDGKLAFSADDLAEWFTLWERMRASRACVPADVQALDRESLDTNALTRGKAACGFIHSNELVALQALVPFKLGMTTYPTGGPGAAPGNYLKPAMLWSVAATARNPEAAVALVNFFVENAGAAKLLGVERGVPASAGMRTAIRPDLDPLGRTMVEFIDAVTPRVGKLPPTPPKGAGEIAILLRRTNQEVGFGRLKPAAGAQQFVAGAQAILARA